MSVYVLYHYYPHDAPTLVGLYGTAESAQQAALNYWGADVPAFLVPSGVIPGAEESLVFSVRKMAFWSDWCEVHKMEVRE